jgi:hypothetical protein
MSFQRVYDVSFVADDLSRRGLVNAIEAVNLACTPVVNAWHYVESREIAQDYIRVIDPSDTMKNIIFNHMKLFSHSGASITTVINALISLATDYHSWKRTQEEANSLLEGDLRIIEHFRQNTLVPYYRSMSGGGSTRAGAGPIVSEFLEIYDRITYHWILEIRRTYDEVVNLLGYTLDERVTLLDDIITNIYSSKRLAKYRDTLKATQANEKRMDDMHNKIITEQIPILRAAIESRNPVALKAALNPGWSSMRIYELNEYKEAQALLDELSSS